MSDDEAAAQSALAVVGSALGEELFRDEERPDEIERTAKAIDFVARGGEHVIAIEHTQIGAFDEQERVVAQMLRVLDPICAELDGSLPDGSQFTLAVDAHVAPRMTAADAEPLKAWIVSAAPGLSSPPNHYVPSPPGVLPTTLYRWPRRGRRRQLSLSIGVQTGDALESLRRERLRRAVETKLPKLEDARGIHAATSTLLVLESPDQQISNAFAIAEALKLSVDDLPLPDFIVLVEDDEAWLIRSGGKWVEAIQPFALPPDQDEPSRR